MKTKIDKISILEKEFKFKELQDGIVDVSKFVDINSNDLELEAEQLPTVLEYFGRMQAKAMRRKNSAETKYKIWHATKDKQVRMTFEKKKVKATENMITSEIRRDAEYLEMKNKIYRAEENYGILNSIYWAIQKKAQVIEELIRQSGVNRNKENKR